jgi:hypothetical protein
MIDTLAIDFRVQAARQICCRRAAPVAAAQLAQLTMLSRTAALAILEAALKQMHVCALLHYDVNHLSHSPACFFCWPHQPELPAAFFLLLAGCLRAGGAGYWMVPTSTGALVLAFSALRGVDLGLAHRNAL